MFNIPFEGCQGQALVPRNQFEKPDTGDGILESVSHHAWAQTLAEMGKDAKERSEHSDDNHHSGTLITVAETEDYC